MRSQRREKPRINLRSQLQYLLRRGNAMISVRKACAAALLGTAAVAVASPAVGQSVRPQVQSAKPSPRAMTIPQPVAKDYMMCTSRQDLHFTTMGYAVVCRDQAFEPIIVAVDHTKFPGGIETVTTLLQGANTTSSVEKRRRLKIEHTPPSAKAKRLCNLINIRGRTRPPCRELLNFYY